MVGYDEQIHYRKYNRRAEKQGNCKECVHNIRVDYVYRCDVRDKTSSYNFTCDRWQLRARREVGGS